TLPPPLASAAGVVHPPLFTAGVQPPLATAGVGPPLVTAGGIGGEAQPRGAAAPLASAGEGTPPPPPPLAAAGALRFPIFHDVLRFWTAELEHMEGTVAPHIELNSFGRRPDAGGANGRSG
ncbi:MAG: hypothetical protein GY772_04695, partial [bacterium]|nr:hypothetical protein [bacterium]